MLQTAEVAVGEAAGRRQFYDRIDGKSMTPLWEVLGALVPASPPSALTEWTIDRILTQRTTASGDTLDCVVALPSADTLKTAERDWRRATQGVSRVGNHLAAVLSLSANVASDRGPNAGRTELDRERRFAA